MPVPRPQFRLSTLLWLTLAVACWFGEMRFERWRTEPTSYFLPDDVLHLFMRVRHGPIADEDAQ